MSVLEAIILGIVQGLTEFLPVSSSGHIELGKALLKMNSEENMLFSLVVHGATVLSILIVFREDILDLLKGLFKFSWNQQTKYTASLLLSMIPLVVLGLGFKDQIATMFTGNLFLVGCMLLLTALLLQLTRFEKKQTQALGWGSVLLVGLAQAVAVIPGISRSGATISTALALGASREEAARFSFLMILIPILGANFVQMLQLRNVGSGSIEMLPLFVGFLAAFISGLFACKVMVALVKKGKIIYFSIYCLIVGAIAIFASF